MIPITAVNRMTSLWGPDAEEFKCGTPSLAFIISVTDSFNSPDRWNNVPEAATSIPSIFSNVLSFMAGARGCIGYRFAIVELVTKSSRHLQYTDAKRILQDESHSILPHTIVRIRARDPRQRVHKAIDGGDASVFEEREKWSRTDAFTRQSLRTT